MFARYFNYILTVGLLSILGLRLFNWLERGRTLTNEELLIGAGVITCLLGFTYIFGYGRET